MEEYIALTPAAQLAMQELKEQIPGVEPEHLLETALGITSALFSKSAEGARIFVRKDDGSEEELKFKVKKPGRKKSN